jgi:hypothetical protein
LNSQLEIGCHYILSHSQLFSYAKSTKKRKFKQLHKQKAKLKSGNEIEIEWSSSLTLIRDVIRMRSTYDAYGYQNFDFIGKVFFTEYYLEREPNSNNDRYLSSYGHRYSGKPIKCVIEKKGKFYSMDHHNNADYQEYEQSKVEREPYKDYEIRNGVNGDKDAISITNEFDGDSQVFEGNEEQFIWIYCVAAKQLNWNTFTAKPFHEI